MKRTILAGLAAVTLVATNAFAADLPRKAPLAPVVVAPAFSWTGFYIGAHVGGAKVERCLSFDLFPGEACIDRTGWLGGGQIGYNWQAGQLVLGVEFSGSFADLGGGNNAGALPGLPGFFFESDGKSLLMLTGRLGWAADRALFYVTGGAARVKADVELFAAPGVSLGDASLTRTGWTFGVGAEYAFTPNWSFAAQYNWIDLGDRDVNFVLFPTFAGNVDQTLHVFTLRMNYRFGGYGPVAARY
jgi:outer membrane immunogenic protein